MYKAFIRAYLLDKGYGAYSKIVELYREQLAFLGTPSRFRYWLATELEVPVEVINLSSLNSAVQQQRKKEKRGKPKSPLSNPSSASNSESKAAGFTFSKPGSDDEKQSRIHEM